MTAVRGRVVRWLVPVAVLGLLLGITGLRATLASATPALPDQTAAQLLTKIANTRVQGLSGVLRTSADLGLPALPETNGELGPQTLLSGEHTLRVYLDGPDRQRIDLLGDLAESKVVHNGRDVWYWSSSTDKATHSQLPQQPPGRHADPRKDAPGKLPDQTPQALAQRLIDMVTPTTQVTVGKNATVARRSAYDLRLAPKTADSLIQRVDLYVDGATGLPLRVTVLTRGASKPAVDVGFTSIKIGSPAAGTFRFSAPAGAKVTERRLPARGWSAKSSPNSHEPHDAVPGPNRSGGAARPETPPPSFGGVRARVLGSGWATAVEIRGGPALSAIRPQLGLLLKGTKSVSGKFGSGRLLTTRLLTVLIADDGRIFAGPVTAPALLRMANAAGPR